MTDQRTLRMFCAMLLIVCGGTLAEKAKGYSEYREDDALIVDGQRVRLGPKTKLDAGGARRVSSIPLGWEVEVKGKRTEDGAILATRLVAERNLPSAIEHQLEEAFDKIEQQYIQKGRMVQTDANGRVVEDMGRLITSGPRHERVNRIMGELVPPYLDPASLRVYVVENPEWNAMAAPNYSIYVFSGLLDDMDDDEVALVLGHELAHATHEHSRQQAERTQWYAIGAMVAGAAISAEVDDDATRLAAQAGTMVATSALVSGYSRNHEDQADRVGMRYAYEAGYDVTKGPQLWQRFADKYGESDVAVNFFFGDHSRSSKRAELLEQQILYNYRDPGN